MILTGRIESTGPPPSRFRRPRLTQCLPGIVLCLIAQAAEIRIEGLRNMDESQALDLLGDRLEYVRERPPTPARAGDAAYLLENLMRRQGFQSPSVDWAIRGGTIHLKVQEGRRLSIGEVQLPDLPKEDATRLGRLFKLPGQERILSRGQAPPYRESDVEEGLLLIEADFRSRGYWRAKASETARSEPTGDGEISFTISVDSGPLHHIGEPRFDGVPEEMLADLHATAAPYVGQVADTDRLTRLRGDIESRFRRAGYLLGTFKMNRILGDGRLTPRFIVVIEERQRFSDLEVVGLEKTHESRVTRRFSDLQGDWFDAEAFDSRLRKLLATGAFSSIRLETETDAAGALHATLHVREGRARGASTYIGAGSYEGAIFGAKYHDRNLFGNLWNFSAGAEFTSRGMLGELRLSEPWLFDTDTYLGLRLFSVTRSQEGYDKFEAGLSAEFSRDLGRHFDASLIYGVSLVNTSSTGIPDFQLGETVYLHQFLRAELAYDRRDSPVKPGRGYHLNALLEGGGVTGDLSSTYLKFETLAAGYIPVGQKAQINLGARAGLLIPSSGNDKFPIDLRLFSGGPDTVRSFPFREMGPKALNGDPLGGEAYWVVNAEYLQSIAGPVKAVVFVDAGHLSGDSALDFGSPELAAGLGLRLDLPVGPIRLEYGHNLTRDRGEPSGSWHFAIGVAF